MSAEKPNISLFLSEQILEIFQQLEKFDNDAAKWIAFCLLDLENELLNSLVQAIFDFKIANIPIGRFRRCSFANDEVVINVVASSSSSLKDLSHHTILAMQAEKYKRRLRKSIGVCILCENKPTKPIFDTVHYIEHDWQYDKNLEELIENRPIFSPVAGSKLPGRNDPCFCGSKLKFKKCCLRKIEINSK